MTEALAHPYLDEGRLRYHSCMCTCCASTSCGGRQYTHDFEPTAPHAFDDTWENEVCGVFSFFVIFTFFYLKKHKIKDHEIFLDVYIIRFKFLNLIIYLIHRNDMKCMLFIS